MLAKLLGLLKQRLRGTRPYRLAVALRQSLAALNTPEQQVVTLTPTQPPRGNVLLSYIIEALLLPPNDPALHKHTHYWETRQMAQTWLDLGYAVDVIRWTNGQFVPQKRYDFFIDVRMNLERIGPRLNPDCVKIMHIETAHWLFHMTAQHRRLLDLQRRRGVSIHPTKVVSPNWGIEHADYATMLGNEFTHSTYRYANKPIYPLPISSMAEYPWPEDKDFDACRKRFLWFGSGGMVHKGLDLTLEAFAQLPDFHLTVCGPVEAEQDFVRAYTQELYQTPNIRTVGWVDVNSPTFSAITRDCVGIIYPSCSEGQCGSVVTCMHAGLIPLVSYETGLDVGGNIGLLLSDCSLVQIQQAVRILAAQPSADLQQRARRAWEYARAHHTRGNFAAAYRSAVEQIIASARAARQPAHMRCDYVPQ